MPLLTFCGYLGCGKSTLASGLVDALIEQQPQWRVVLVQEDVTKPTSEQQWDARSEVYADSKRERELRSKLKTDVERALTGSNTGDLSEPKSQLLVLVDAPNYIKGFRYELYCLAKSLGHQHIVVHFDSPGDIVLTWNKHTARYPQTLLEEVITRFEPPNPNQRWDQPLVSVHPHLFDEGAKEPVEHLVHEVMQILSKSSKSVVKPNQSTQSQVILPSNFLQNLEHATQVIVDHVLSCQAVGAEAAGVPASLSQGADMSVRLQLSGRTGVYNLAQLTKSRRRFISMLRSNPATFMQTPPMLASQFLRFLSTLDAAASSAAPGDSWRDANS